MTEQPAITSTTRAHARRFLREHETALHAEIHGYLEGGMAEPKFLELLGVEKNRIAGRHAAFIREMWQLANGGTPDAAAIQDGLNMVAGMVQIAANADGMAAKAASPVMAEKKYRRAQGMERNDDLTPWDKHQIARKVQKHQRILAPLEQDLGRWKEAARQMVEVAGGVGVPTQGYAEHLGIGRFQE